jgi:putative hydrolase of the HAD superfamily
VLLPHAESMIERLRARGHKLFFLSNMPMPYAAHLETNYPLSTWFDDGVFSSRVKLLKPEPAIFHEATRRFGAAPGEIVFIDDFALNIKGARAVGWDAIHFLSAEQCEADLRSRGLI